MTETPTERQLVAKYGAWGWHPDHLVSDWQNAVLNDETRLGYWRWVEARLADDLDLPD